MSYREVTMLEIKEVLRLWCGGAAKKRIAAQLGLDIKTVRRYLRAAQACGAWPAGDAPLDDERVAAVVAALQPEWGRPLLEAIAARPGEGARRRLAQGRALQPAVEPLEDRRGALVA